MTRRFGLTVLLVLVALLLPGCDAAAAIFEAGWWLGLIVAGVVVGAIVLLISRMRR
jgi:hypothetical protein